jgi:hypothetical protein
MASDINDTALLASDVVSSELVSHPTIITVVIARVIAITSLLNFFIAGLLVI